MEYIFSSYRLYPVDRALETDPGGGILVEPDTLVCYDVKAIGNNNFMGASTWHFKVHGHGDVVYKTHYAWALMLNTPENVARNAEFRAAQSRAEQARLAARRLGKLVLDVSHESAATPAKGS